MLLRIFALLSLVLSGVLVASLDLALWLFPVLFVGLVLAMVLAFCLGLCLFALAVDMDKPQEHNSKLYRTLAHLTIEMLIPLAQLKIEVSGLEKTPAQDRIMLVCNHQNEADPAILMHYFPGKKLAFVAKKEARGMFLIGQFMHKIMCQLVNRENDREALKTILKCIQLLKNDEVSIGAFPEGGIFEKDKLHHFRSGIFKIAQKAKVPIVVCTLKGTSDIFRNLKRLKPTHIRLHLVDVIPTEEVVAANTVELGDQIFQMMLNDLGPEYAPENTETP